MKKEHVVNAILFFASLYEQEKNYKSLMESFQGLPKIVEMITYEMFIRQFCYYGCPDNQYQQYKILLAYAQQLKEHGYVTFTT